MKSIGIVAKCLKNGMDVFIDDCSGLFSRTIVEPVVPFQGPVTRKSRELFGPEKPFVKLRPVYSVKLIFSHVVKGIKIEITAKFRASRRLRFEDTKRIMSPEIRPKRFGTFEKQAPGLNQVAVSRDESVPILPVVGAVSSRLTVFEVS